MGFANYLVTKTGNLVRTYIQSPDFVAGVSGWRLGKNGIAEFNNGTITITLSDESFLVINGNSIQFFKSDGITAFGLIDVFDPVNGGLAIFGQNGAASSAMYLLADAAGSIVIPGQIAANEPGNIAGTVEPWHQATPLLNSWAGSGSGVNGLFYRFTAINEVELLGDLSSPGTATEIFQLPADYRPAGSGGINIPFHRYDDSGTAHALVASTGAITMQTVVGAGKGMFVNARIPLGTI